MFASVLISVCPSLLYLVSTSTLLLTLTTFSLAIHSFRKVATSILVGKGKKKKVNNIGVVGLTSFCVCLIHMRVGPLEKNCLASPHNKTIQASSIILNNHTTPYSKGKKPQHSSYDKFSLQHNTSRSDQYLAS